MKYDIQFTNQFKKDLKLAKKQNKNLDKLFEVIDILANDGWIQNTKTMTLQATIRARVSVILNRTSCLFMRFVEMFLFWCFIALVRILSCLRNNPKIGKLQILTLPHSKISSWKVIFWFFPKFHHRADTGFQSNCEHN